MSSKPTASKNGKDGSNQRGKDGSNQRGKDGSNPRGKVLYELREMSKEKTGDKQNVVEKIVIRAENSLFCKLFTRKDDMAHRVTVESKSTGGQYTVKVAKGKADELTPQTTTYDKKGLLEMLKSDKNLEFMASYIAKEKSLSRTGSKKKSSKSSSKKSSSKKPSSKKTSKKSSKPKESGMKMVVKKSGSKSGKKKVAKKSGSKIGKK